jgi:hypothetical protein
VVREIDASGGRIGGRANANAGRICGIVGTVLIGVSLAVVLFIFAFAIISVGTMGVWSVG